MQNIKDIPVQEIVPGFFGRMIHGNKSTMVCWDIKKDSVMPEHHHPHEQITYIAEGELKMKIGGEDFAFTTGNTHVITSNTPHSAIAMTDCKVMDFFSPAREEYKL